MDRQSVALTKIMLEKKGYEVTTATNSTECFEKLKEKRPDLILMDVMMHGNNDGWTSCKKIKEDEKTRDISVVMFTILAAEADQERSREAHAVSAHISKLFIKDNLFSTVEDLI